MKGFKITVTCLISAIVIVAGVFTTLVVVKNKRDKQKTETLLTLDTPTALGIVKNYETNADGSYKLVNDQKVLKEVLLTVKENANATKGYAFYYKTDSSSYFKVTSKYNETEKKYENFYDIYPILQNNLDDKYYFGVQYLSNNANYNSKIYYSSDCFEPTTSKLSSVTLSIAGTTIYLTNENNEVASLYAKQYEIYETKKDVDGTTISENKKIATLSPQETSYNIVSPSPLYTYYYTCKVISNHNYRTDSDLSNTVSYAKAITLSTPTNITFNDSTKVLSWNSVDYCKKYKIDYTLNNENYTAYSTVNSFDFNSVISTLKQSKTSQYPYTNIEYAITALKDDSNAVSCSTSAKSSPVQYANTTHVAAPNFTCVEEASFIKLTIDNSFTCEYGNLIYEITISDGSNETSFELNKQDYLTQNIEHTISSASFGHNITINLKVKNISEYIIGEESQKSLTLNNN